MTSSDVPVRASIDGDEVTLRVAPAEVTLAGDTTPIRVTSIQRESSFLLTLSGGDTTEPSPAPVRAQVALVDGVAWVFVDGDVFRIDVDEAQHEPVRRRDRAGQDALAAPMPATVTRILVELGQQVARGDTLLLLEAMKMELPIKASRDGRVIAIHCLPGELVQPGVALLELESSSAS